jgi:hypothetical protein
MRVYTYVCVCLCVCIPCLLRLSFYVSASLRRTCAAFVHRCALNWCAHVCVCGRTRISAKCASTSSRCRASRSRLAGVPLGDSVQREHRRVEHRLCHGFDRGMRRFRPGTHRGGLRSVGDVRSGAADVCVSARACRRSARRRPSMRTSARGTPRE